MIINVHAHLGDTVVFDAVSEEGPLLEAMDAAGIDASIVMPSAGARDAAAVHDMIADLAERHPGRFYGQIQYSPHVPEGELEREAERCVKDLGFVGIKMHTMAGAVNPLSTSGRRLCNIAQQHNIPLMIHTGVGVPWALPSMVIPLARDYPNVNFILAHAGMTVFTMEAWIAADLFHNVYLEPSWCNPSDIGFLISKLGANRIMLGGDLPHNYVAEVTKFKSLNLSEEDLNWCLADTAIEVYNLPIEKS